ncbi:hypothetical protein [Kordia sp.]|uniref:hypothetical protein n=1 Tax=Kordia sp. TaxID=1965332 RepID=UPI003D285766
MKNIIYLVFLLSLSVFGQEEKKKKILDATLIMEIDLMHEKDQLYRGSILYDQQHLLSEEERKTLWKFQFAIDDKNTKRLIEIVKKYGYVNQHNSNLEYISILPLFLHSPKKYWKDIKSLIDREKRKGNIKDATYDKIISHMKFSIPEDLKINYLSTKKNDSLNKQ